MYILWRECIPIEFYQHTCKEKNFVYLNGRDVGKPGALEIVGNFIDQGKENLRLLQKHLVRFKDIYQYVFLHIFPEIYTASEKRGFDLKSNFHIIFKSYCDKILIRQIAKQQSIYQNHTERFEQEQKPIKNFDAIADEKEEKIKEKNEIQNKIRREHAEKKQIEKRKLKLEDEKNKEEHMWERLHTLNTQFKKIKEAKKEEKEIGDTILK